MSRSDRERAEGFQRVASGAVAFPVSERAEGSCHTPSSAVGTVVPAGALAGGPAALLRIRSGVPDGLYRPTEVDIGISLVTVGRAAVCVVGFLDREAGFLGDRLGGESHSVPTSQVPSVAPPTASGEATRVPRRMAGVAP